jgi:hypothetical protein
MANGDLKLPRLADRKDEAIAKYADGADWGLA